jgi:hypothetical protein
MQGNQPKPPRKNKDRKKYFQKYDDNRFDRKVEVESENE